MSKGDNQIASAIFVLCVFLCFVFSVICVTKLDNSNSAFIASIGKNWNSGPISDVTQGGLSCPTGKFSIINDDWDGTNSGCLCPDTLGDKLRWGTCTDKYQRHCQKISPVKAVHLNHWRSTNLCGKRGPIYLRMKTAASPKNCGGDYKSCGKIDTLGNYLCYPENIPCPYNFISINSKDFVVPTDKKYTIIPLGENGYKGKAIFSNEYTESNIINEFKVDDNTPCLSPDYKNLNHKPYLLEIMSGEKCENVIGGQKFDKSFIKVDSITYNQLYSDNEIMPIIKQLPQFNTKYNYLESQTSLFYKNYIGMNKKCLEKMIKNENPEELIKSFINIEEEISSTKICAIVVMVLSIFGMLGWLIFVFGKICCPLDDDNAFVWALIIVVCIPALICGSVIVGKINSNNFDFSPLAQVGCTDSVTQSVLREFTSKISLAKNMAAANLSFGLVGIFAGVLAILQNK